jgi:hypothetical protein
MCAFVDCVCECVCCSEVNTAQSLVHFPFSLRPLPLRAAFARSHQSQNALGWRVQQAK